MTLKIILAIVFVVSGGVAYSEDFKGHKFLRFLVIIISILATFYLFKDVLTDIKGNEKSTTLTPQIKTPVPTQFDGYANQCEEQCGDFELCEIDYNIKSTNRRCDLAYRQLPSQYRNDYRGKQVIAEILKGMNLTVKECEENTKQYFEVEIKKHNECSERLQKCKKNCN
jgi:hypothetical protein